MEPDTDAIFKALAEASRSPINDQEIDEDLDHRLGKQDLRFRPWMFWSVVGLMIGEVFLMFILVFLPGLSKLLWADKI